SASRTPPGRCPLPTGPPTCTAPWWSREPGRPGRPPLRRPLPLLRPRSAATRALARGTNPAGVVPRPGRAGASSGSHAGGLRAGHAAGRRRRSHLERGGGRVARAPPAAGPGTHRMALRGAGTPPALGPPLPLDRAEPLPDRGDGVHGRDLWSAPAARAAITGPCQGPLSPAARSDLPGRLPLPPRPGDAPLRSPGPASGGRVSRPRGELRRGADALLDRRRRPCPSHCRRERRAPQLRAHLQRRPAPRAGGMLDRLSLLRLDRAGLSLLPVGQPAARVGLLRALRDTGRTPSPECSATPSPGALPDALAARPPARGVGAGKALPRRSHLARPHGHGQLLRDRAAPDLGRLVRAPDAALGPQGERSLHVPRGA